MTLTGSTSVNYGSRITRQLEHDMATALPISWNLRKRLLALALELTVDHQVKSSFIWRLCDSVSGSAAEVAVNVIIISHFIQGIFSTCKFTGSGDNNNLFPSLVFLLLPLCLHENVLLDEVAGLRKNLDQPVGGANVQQGTVEVSSRSSKRVSRRGRVRGPEGTCQRELRGCVRGDLRACGGVSKDRQVFIDWLAALPP